MILLSSAYVHLRYPHVTPDELEQAAETAYKITQSVAKQYFPTLDVEIHILVEEGTLSTRAKVGAALVALYIGIGEFGDFVGGVRTIAEIGRVAAGEINERFIDAVGAKQNVIRTRRDNGLPGKLERLFKNVEEGRLSPEEATQKALRLLERSGEILPPTLVNAIEDSVAALHHQPSLDKDRIIGGQEEIRDEIAEETGDEIAEEIGDEIRIRDEIGEETGDYTGNRIRHGIGNDISAIQESLRPKAANLNAAEEFPPPPLQSRQRPPETPHPEPRRAIEIWKKPGQAKRKKRWM